MFASLVYDAPTVKLQNCKGLSSICSAIPYAVTKIQVTNSIDNILSPITSDKFMIYLKG